MDIKETKMFDELYQKLADRTFNEMDVYILTSENNSSN
jgi:hypothetical protein